MGVTITALPLHSATEKISTSRIQKPQHYPSERDAEGVVPYNSKYKATPHPRATSYRRKIAPLFADTHLLRDRENGADYVTPI